MSLLFSASKRVLISLSFERQFWNNTLKSLRIKRNKPIIDKT